ncbi:MAG: hypothetical protein ACXVPD_07490, partial [Bacteroidia bacterium]
MKAVNKDIFEDIPSGIDTNKTLRLIKSGTGTKTYLVILKDITNEDDQEMSDWLDISVKTFRSYKNTKKSTKSAVTEHAIMLISLVKHGLDVFGNYLNFKSWLEKDNFYFDSKPPIQL